MSTDTTRVPAKGGTVMGTAGALDTSGSADINAAGKRSTAASGAIVETGALDKVPVDHPAVDNNPRGDTTVDMNRIDMNSPDNRIGGDERAIIDRMHLKPADPPEPVHRVTRFETAPVTEPVKAKKD